MNFSNLSCADCREANFGGAKLERVYAANVDFTEAIGSFFGHSILAGSSFKDSSLIQDSICREGNFIYRTVMPDGTIKFEDFHCGC